MDKIRQKYLEKIESDFGIVSACALLGPRQCGKTTIARQFAATFKGEVHYFDLEDYTDLAALASPKLALDHLKGLIIIDEIQRIPDLFPYLRVLLDRPSKQAQFLILGSASRDLIQQSSETLAGRLSYIAVSPFLLEEAKEESVLWIRGGFPKSFLASSDEASMRWRQIYTQTYFEKDLADLGLNIPPQRMLQFWSMLKHYHGNVLNYAKMAQFMDISVPKIKDYLRLLEGTFMIRILAPWHSNGGARLVKTPKLYIRDSGIYHYLLSVRSYEELTRSLDIGASWEGFAMEEITGALDLRNEECYFWSTHQDAELDLLCQVRGRLTGFEFKTTDSPKVTKSMRSALQSLKLDHLYIVTPAERTFAIEEHVTHLALKDIAHVFNRY